MLGPAGLVLLSVLLLLHVLASHPLSPLGESQTARTLLPSLKAGLMIARMTVFTAQALVELVREDNVLVISTELTNEALGLAEHAFFDVAGAEAQQISQLWRQTAIADS